MVFAHQGGWDEILMVAVPVAIFSVLLFIANRRANTLAQDRAAEAPVAPSPAADDEAEAVGERGEGEGEGGTGGDGPPPATGDGPGGDGPPPAGT